MEMTMSSPHFKARFEVNVRRACCRTIGTVIHVRAIGDSNDKPPRQSLCMRCFVCPHARAVRCSCAHKRPSKPSSAKKQAA